MALSCALGLLQLVSILFFIVLFHLVHGNLTLNLSLKPWTDKPWTEYGSCGKGTATWIHFPSQAFDGACEQSVALPDSQIFPFSRNVILAFSE